MQIRWEVFAVGDRNTETGCVRRIKKHGVRPSPHSRRCNRGFSACFDLRFLRLLVVELSRGFFLRPSVAPALAQHGPTTFISVSNDGDTIHSSGPHSDRFSDAE